VQDATAGEAARDAAVDAEADGAVNSLKVLD
jgi:hypothetical protein